MRNSEFHKIEKKLNQNLGKEKNNQWRGFVVGIQHIGIRRVLGATRGVFEEVQRRWDRSHHHSKFWFFKYFLANKLQSTQMTTSIINMNNPGSEDPEGAEGGSAVIYLVTIYHFKRPNLLEFEHFSKSNNWSPPPMHSPNKCFTMRPTANTWSRSKMAAAAHRCGKLLPLMGTIRRNKTTIQDEKMDKSPICILKHSNVWR